MLCVCVCKPHTGSSTTTCNTSMTIFMSGRGPGASVHVEEAAEEASKDGPVSVAVLRDAVCFEDCSIWDM